MLPVGFLSHVLYYQGWCLYLRKECADEADLHWPQGINVVEAVPPIRIRVLLPMHWAPSNELCSFPFILTILVQSLSGEHGSENSLE